MFVSCDMSNADQLHRTEGEVVEIEPGGVRMRVGKHGHQHRILFDVPDGLERRFRVGAKVAVYIEIPNEPDAGRQA